MANEYDWPGWPLAENPYGRDFDVDARIRMVQGSRMLLPLLEKYRTQMGLVVLEAGPFFEPLVIPDSRRTVIYVDNDSHVVQYLKAKYRGVHSLLGDFNRGEEKEIVTKISTALQQTNSRVDVVVASQLLNYVNYRTFFNFVGTVLRPEGLFFINHSTDYGLPAYFSAKRPKSNDELLVTMKEKFQIVEKIEIPSTHPAQLHPRLLITAQMI